MKLDERLAIHFTNLTTTDKKICRQLMQSPEIALAHPVQEIANQLNVAPSSIVRMCKKLGYRGLTEFKLDLENYQLSQDTVNNESLTQSTFKQINLSLIDYLNLLNHSDLQDDLSQIKKWIKDYRYTKAIGIGNSGLVAEQLVYSLYTQNIFTEAIRDQTKLNYLSESLDENFLFIIFSVSGNKKNFETFVKNATKNNSRVVLITMNSSVGYEKYLSKKIVLPSNLTQIPSDDSLIQLDNRIFLFLIAEILAKIN